MGSFSSKLPKEDGGLTTSLGNLVFLRNFLWQLSCQRKEGTWKTKPNCLGIIPISKATWLGLANFPSPLLNGDLGSQSPWEGYTMDECCICYFNLQLVNLYYTMFFQLLIHCVIFHSILCKKNFKLCVYYVTFIHIMQDFHQFFIVKSCIIWMKSYTMDERLKTCYTI